MRQQLFITATDTGSGKTYVSCQLLDYFKRQGKRVVGLKPIASGSDELGQNEDALLLQQHSNIELDYTAINPVCLKEPVAPHIAAIWEGKSISVSDMRRHLQSIEPFAADVTLVEGAGGVCVPLNADECWLDFIEELKLPVILVVGMTLGCINHALLSERVLLNSGANLVGWIANQLHPDMLAYEENISTLKNWLSTPLLSRVNYQGMIKSLALPLPN